MTRFVSFFERPLVGSVTAVTSIVSFPIGSIIEVTQPYIGYFTLLCGALTGFFIAAIWARKFMRTLIADWIRTFNWLKKRFRSKARQNTVPPIPEEARSEPPFSKR